MTAVRAGKYPGPRYQCRISTHPPELPGKSILRARLDGLVHGWLEALVDDSGLRSRAEGDATR